MNHEAQEEQQEKSLNNNFMTFMPFMVKKENKRINHEESKKHEDKKGVF